MPFADSAQGRVRVVKENYFYTLTLRHRGHARVTKLTVSGHFLESSSRKRRSKEDIMQHHSAAVRAATAVAVTADAAAAAAAAVAVVEVVSAVVYFPPLPRFSQDCLIDPKNKVRQ